MSFNARTFLCDAVVIIHALEVVKQSSTADHDMVL